MSSNEDFRLLHVSGRKCLSLFVHLLSSPQLNKSFVCRNPRSSIKPSVANVLSDDLKINLSHILEQLCEKGYMNKDKLCDGSILCYSFAHDKLQESAYQLSVPSAFFSSLSFFCSSSLYLPTIRCVSAHD